MNKYILAASTAIQTATLVFTIRMAKELHKIYLQVCPQSFIIGQANDEDEYNTL